MPVIAGLQKLTILDFPEKVACTVFTGGCNLRCPYCHNSELLYNPEPFMSEDEFFAFLSGRTGKLEGVCVSGGEPCINADLPDFIKRIRNMGFAVKLDTNGCYPDMLETLLKRDILDYTAVDIKSSAAEYDAAAGVKGFPLDRLIRSLKLLLEHGGRFEVRTTVVEPLHTRKTMMDIRDCFTPLVEEGKRRFPAFYLQGFVDRDTVPCSGFSAPIREKLEEYREILSPLAERVEIRGVR